VIQESFYSSYILVSIVDSFIYSKFFTAIKQVMERNLMTKFVIVKYTTHFQFYNVGMFAFKYVFSI
jgi:hypothetical protein